MGLKRATKIDGKVVEWGKGVDLGVVGFGGTCRAGKPRVGERFVRGFATIVVEDRRRGARKRIENIFVTVC